MPKPINITPAERDEAVRIAKTLKTPLSDTQEANAILAGLKNAKDEGIIDDSPEQTARKASIGVVEYLKQNNLVLPEKERVLLVNASKALASKIVQGR